MAKKIRVRIGADGEIRLPADTMEQLGWGSRHVLEVTLTEAGVRLEKIDVDPFEEAMKKPDPDAFDRILADQKESQKKAFDTFDERIKDPPEVQPEDRPDQWR